MLLSDFRTLVDNHEDLRLISVEIDTGTVSVEHLPTGLGTKLDRDAILGFTWDVLLPVLTIDREPDSLQHMTRVVGYYSRVNNWNKSKQGELKDRQSGNYAVRA